MQSIPSHPIPSHPIRSLILALGLGLCSLNAAAAIITFDFGALAPSVYGSSLNITSGGVTLSLTNPAVHPTQSEFETDGDGIFITDDTNFSGVTSFDLKLSVDAKITGYSITYNQDLTSASFNLTGGRTGAASSLNNSLLTSGNFSLSSDYILNANQTGSFSATLTGNAFRVTQLHTLTIDTNVTSNNVPEPSALALFGLGLAGFRSFRRAKS
ncbi:MAG: PEP-CTERM sorting domain-containing protein [Methylococcales bacterium]|nr:PEP-CTERM sorting domain-containing protein [Methylococcales bacterium]